MGDRNIEDEIAEGLREAVEWSKGHGECRVTQWACGNCKAPVELTDEVCKDELPLLCEECQMKGNE